MCDATTPDQRPIRPLARRDGEPAFDEPWQAQVLALADALAARGVFTRAAWSAALGAELRSAAARGAPDDSQSYYVAALAALEKLVAADGRITVRSLDERVETWRRAYHNTPHGQPVELAAASRPRDRAAPCLR